MRGRESTHRELHHDHRDRQHERRQRHHRRPDRFQDCGRSIGPARHPAWDGLEREPPVEPDRDDRYCHACEHAHDGNKPETRADAERNGAGMSRPLPARRLCHPVRLTLDRADVTHGSSLAALRACRRLDVVGGRTAAPAGNPTAVAVGVRGNDVTRRPRELSFGVRGRSRAPQAWALRTMLLCCQGAGAVRTRQRWATPSVGAGSW